MYITTSTAAQNIETKRIFKDLPLHVISPISIFFNLGLLNGLSEISSMHTDHCRDLDIKYQHGNWCIKSYT